MDDDAAAFQGAKPPRFGRVNIRRRRLPHWETEGGLYFVTFHLVDSLPAAVRAQIQVRRRLFKAATVSGRKLLPHEEAAIAELSSKKIQEYLDAGYGACYLRDDRVANLVADALRFRDHKTYRLIAWCIMPNQVHVVLRLLPGQSLAAVLSSWKSYTARMANRILGRCGSFWERECYDRLIRNGEELTRAVNYVLDNPVKAGLKNWKWVWATEGDGMAAL